MLTILLIKKIIQLLIMMAMGYMLVKVKVVKSEDSIILSKMCLYLIVPCTILKAFQVEFTNDILQGLIFAVIASIFYHVILLFLMEIIKKIFKLNVVEEASIFYSNAGNLIIPLVSYMLGDEWVVYSSAFMSVQLVFIWTHGVSLFHKGQFNLKKILLNINLISIVIGIFLMISKIQVPDIINETLGSVGGMIGPVAMIIAGMLAANMTFKQLFVNKRIYLTVFLRLILIPGIIFALIKILMLGGIVSKGDYIMLIVFLALMTPSAATIVQFAQVYGSDDIYAGAINIVSTVLCMITMPIWVMLYLG